MKLLRLSFILNTQKQQVFICFLFCKLLTSSGSVLVLNLVFSQHKFLKMHATDTANPAIILEVALPYDMDYSMENNALCLSKLPLL